MSKRDLLDWWNGVVRDSSIGRDERRRMMESFLRRLEALG